MRVWQNWRRLHPAARRGTVWDGLIHSADWYRTVTEGMARGVVSNNTAQPGRSFNLWDSILGSGPSPRHEVIHQVSNAYFTEHVVAMRLGDFKLIIGNPGDARTLSWPALSQTDVAFGMTGGSTRDGGATCLSGIVTGKAKDMSYDCQPGCLFNLRNDPGEVNNLYGHIEYAQMIQSMRSKLHAAGKGPHHRPRSGAIRKKVWPKFVLRQQRLGTWNHWRFRLSTVQGHRHIHICRDIHRNCRYSFYSRQILVYSRNHEPKIKITVCVYVYTQGILRFMLSFKYSGTFLFCPFPLAKAKSTSPIPSASPQKQV